VLSFQLAVCNGFTCGGLSSVNVTVTAAVGAPAVTLRATVPPATGNTTSVSLGQAVTLTATATGGTAPLTFTFAQTAGPAQALAGAGATRTFTATLPPGTPTPATIGFTVTVTDAAVPPRTTTATLTILVGPDAITVANVTYALAKSRLQVSVNDSVPGGVAVLTATPFDANGVPIAAGIVLFFDPTLNTYVVPFNWLVNPVPNFVQVTSSLGGTLLTPVQKIR
jgi:hypothetical protein